jgi:alpha/beta superfamily hydrolase
MKEEQIFFESEGLAIEGLISEGETQNAVVVTHPHPLYGGEMHNNVVEAVIRAYCEREYTTLRFNFRGVGRSQGAYDEGVGEQSDVREAVAYLAQLGKTAVDVAGYSFGSWINAKCIDSLTHVKRMIMVSPPVAFMDFSFFKECPHLRLVVAGSEDDIASPSMIQKMLPAWNPEALFKEIQGADHFYWGKTQEIEAIISDWLGHDG